MTLKKRIVSLLLAVVFCFGTASVAFAADSPVSAPAAGVVEIATNVKVVVAEDKTCVYSYNKTSNKSVTVPGTVEINNETCTVVAIGANAFNGAYVKSVTVPASVTAIKAKAFKGDHKLTSIKVNSKTLKVSKDAFYGLKKSEKKKIKVTVSKKMSAKEFKALKNKLVSCGLSAKNIVRK